MSRPIAELHCRVQGTGPAVVLLHPAGLDHTAMAGVAAALAASPVKRRVVSVDLRGHGLSPDAAAGTSMADHADDVNALIGRHCEGAAVVLGVSFGGMVAQELALRHPASVAGLLLCGCGATFADEFRPALRQRGLDAERNGMAAVVDTTLDRWFTPAARSGPLADAVRDRLLRDKPANWSATWQTIATHDALPRLGAVRVPTAVVAGEHDAATPAAASRQLAAAISAARWICIPGAPHMMQLECGDAFNAQVLAFLASRAAGAGRGAAGVAP
ncbi:alpha/beta fold hydrolase [Bordetella sp. H567]|uniref:alpha/beta fold hydrolase n=1 Tax=Bordetella sp. H567 TaxID=1697043 RepID=UPI000831A6C8|nr:alpha/beta hydrolase [Bordetella sp. H567]